MNRAEVLHFLTATEETERNGFTLEWWRDPEKMAGFCFPIRVINGFLNRTESVAVWKLSGKTDESWVFPVTSEVKESWERLCPHLPGWESPRFFAPPGRPLSEAKFQAQEHPFSNSEGAAYAIHWDRVRRAEELARESWALWNPPGIRLNPDPILVWSVVTKNQFSNRAVPNLKKGLSRALRLSARCELGPPNLHLPQIEVWSSGTWFLEMSPEGILLGCPAF